MPSPHQKLAPYKHLATWQRRVVANVDGLIARNSQTFGKMYATFLQKQVNRLNATFGVSVVRRPQTANSIRREHVRHAIDLIREAHPDASVREIQYILGISKSTVHYYLYHRPLGEKLPKVAPLQPNPPEAGLKGELWH